MRSSLHRLDAKSPVAASTAAVLPTLSCSQSDTLAQPFFDRQAAMWTLRYAGGTYKQRRELVRQIVRNELLRLGRPASTAKLLDFGCGSGVVMKDAGDLGL